MKKWVLRGLMCRNCLEILEEENEMGKFPIKEVNKIDLSLFRGKKFMDEMCQSNGQPIYVEITIKEVKK